MIRLARLRTVLLTVMTVVLLLSCAQVPVVLWTDVAELAPAVEAFNAAQELRVVELVYVPDIPTRLRLEPSAPDLVISQFIEDQSTAQMFQPLDGLVRREIGRTQFYDQLLETGRRNGRQLLLPVSFNMPLIYFPEPVLPIDRVLTLGSGELRSRAEQFNRGTGERWTHLAFSPVWNQQFLYQYFRALGLHPTENAGGLPGWDPSVVAQGLSEVAGWIEQTSGSLSLNLDFAERYLYAPELTLVRSQRIAYGYSRSDQFLSLTEEQRAGLGYRWYAEDGVIEVLEDVVFAAVPQDARNVPGAQEFLVYLFDESHQSAIMEQGLEKQIDWFGIAGGFSSLWRVTERSMELLYPELSGMIPPRRSLSFPPPSPRHWGSLVEQTIEPWLLREATGMPQPRNLEAAVRAWLLQQEQ